MSSSGIFIILAIICYLVGMILIGYRHSKGTNNSSDFYLGSSVPSSPPRAPRLQT